MKNNDIFNIDEAMMAGGREAYATENMADFFANAAKEKFPNATIRKNGQTVQEPPKREVPKAAPVDVEELELRLAKLKAEYEQMGGDSWQYADRMMPRDIKAKEIHQAMWNLGRQIAHAKQNMSEAEGDCEGLPHLTPTLAKHISQQIDTEGPHAVEKSIEWGDGAAEELLAKIKEMLDDYASTANESAAWQKKSGKNKNGGLNRKGVASYRREHPGSKLQTAVTTKPSKLKPGSKAAKRRKSFCARMGGMKGPMKDEHGKPTRKALALRKWNCESVEQFEMMLEFYLEKAEMLTESLRTENPCWKGYKPVGTKKKNGKTVPNCVPNEGVAEGMNNNGVEVNNIEPGDTITWWYNRAHPDYEGVVREVRVSTLIVYAPGSGAMYQLTKDDIRSHKKGVAEAEHTFKGANGPVTVDRKPGVTTVKRDKWRKSQENGTTGGGDGFTPGYGVPHAGWTKRSRKLDYDTGDYSNDPFHEGAVPDYKAMYESKLNEFASCGGTGGIATSMSVGNPAAGSLFGGSYSQKNNPFKKTAKKRSGKMLKR